MQSTKEGLI